MKKKKNTDEVETQEVEKKIKNSAYYHNIIGKLLIVLLVTFICFFSYYVYILNDKFTNNYLESLFKAFFLIVVEVIMLLYKNNNSKSFGVLCIINSILIIVLTFLFGKYEILYALLAFILVRSYIIFLSKFKQEEHSEEDVRDGRIFISLIPVFISLLVFLAFAFFKAKVLFSIIIGLIFISSFSTASTVIYFRYFKKKKVLFMINIIFFSLVYIAFGVFNFF